MPRKGRCRIIATASCIVDVKGVGAFGGQAQAARGADRKPRRVRGRSAPRPRPRWHSYNRFVPAAPQASYDSVSPRCSQPDGAADEARRQPPRRKRLSDASKRYGPEHPKMIQA